MSLSKFFKGDKVIWAIFFFLCIISLVEVLSAGSKLTYIDQTVADFSISHGKKILAAMCFAVFFSMVPWRYFNMLPLPLYGIMWVCLLITLFFGQSVNGASRSFFGIFQPSEFMKGAVIIMEAFILALMLNEDGKETDRHAIWYILGMTGAAVLLIATENLSTAVLLCLAVLILMFIGRVPRRQLYRLCGVGVVGVVFFWAFLFSLPKPAPAEETPYEELVEQAALRFEKKAEEQKNKGAMHRAVVWRNRLESAWQNRGKRPVELDYMGDDMQSVHAGIAISNSRGLGLGPGRSKERDRLDQAYSDFIFAIIVEEWGIAGGLFVIILYLLLMWRCLKLAQWCERPFPAYMMVGLAVLIVLQAMMNIFVAVGLMPVTGQTLPLISRGGTATIAMGFYFGLILSISRYCLKCKKRRMLNY